VCCGQNPPKETLTVDKAKKTAKEPKAKTGRKLKYDPDRILKLWEQGKSINEIADAMKPISKVFVHRTLTLKFHCSTSGKRKTRHNFGGSRFRGIKVSGRPRNYPRLESLWREPVGLDWNTCCTSSSTASLEVKL
jgi:hypothetical protein